MATSPLQSKWLKIHLSAPSQGAPATISGSEQPLQNVPQTTYGKEMSLYLDVPGQTLVYDYYLREITASSGTETPVYKQGVAGRRTTQVIPKIVPAIQPASAPRGQQRVTGTFKLTSPGISSHRK